MALVLLYSIGEEYQFLHHLDTIATKHGTLLIDTLQELEQQPDQRISPTMAQSDKPQFNVSIYPPLSFHWRRGLLPSSVDFSATSMGHLSSIPCRNLNTNLISGSLPQWLNLTSLKSM
jgi:hypothetical protein